MIPASRLFQLLGSIALYISRTHQLSIPPDSSDALTTALKSPSAQADTSVPAGPPFYMIAHRVLTVKGVDDAIVTGANAVEIDLTAFMEGWWADHDHTENSWGDSAEDMFHKIADVKNHGSDIIFVWLDIKNPDWCDPNDSKWQHCSVGGLQDLARDILQPAGVRVLYGYVLSANSKTYAYIRDGLNSNEAINLDGNPKKVLERFEEGGPSDKSKRVSSYGDDDISFEFGTCQEDEYNTCTELRQAVDTGKFGKVFGWTSTAGDSDYVDKELGTAGVDGMIYGYAGKNFDDGPDTRAAAFDIRSWAKMHSDLRSIATNSNPPW